MGLILNISITKFFKEKELKNLVRVWILIGVERLLLKALIK
jgi:hypothetical protein